ncbi:hypothetical protein MHU86_2347 [Fragilaria crotonensis]|nr:hypothetical protein MHU86_2347 [Fragilaria crotonensis]
MNWLSLLAVPWLHLTAVTADFHHHLRRDNDFEHRLLQQTCPATTTCNPIVFSCDDPGYVSGSGPCYQVGQPSCLTTGAGVRFRNLVFNGAQEIFMGAGDLGLPTLRSASHVAWSNGCYPFSWTFTPPPADTLVLAGIGTPNPLTIPSVAAVVNAKSAAPSAGWNGLSIAMTNRPPAGYDGNVDLLQVTLSKADGTDEKLLGDFCGVLKSI